MRRVISELHESADVCAVLSDAVRPEPAWYLNGSPWVQGSVRHRQPTYYPHFLSPIPPHPLFF
jgi:cytochrome c oxidase assembly factor 1